MLNHVGRDTVGRNHRPVILVSVLDTFLGGGRLCDEQWRFAGDDFAQAANVISHEPSLLGREEFAPDRLWIEHMRAVHIDRLRAGRVGKATIAESENQLGLRCLYRPAKRVPFPPPTTQQTESSKLVGAGGKYRMHIG
jgi:hypothetical protein